MDEEIVTSPELPTQDTLVTSAKHFSGTQTLDLTDEEIQRAWRIIQRIRRHWMEIFRRKFNDPSLFKLDDALALVEQFEDEIKTELMEKVGILVSVNTLPILEGDPLEIEFLGKIEGSDLHRYGMDHEKKAWEVKRANTRKESFLGESEG